MGLEFTKQNTTEVYEVKIAKSIIVVQTDLTNYKIDGPIEFLIFKKDNVTPYIMWHLWDMNEFHYIFVVVLKYLCTFISQFN